MEIGTRVPAARAAEIVLGSRSAAGRRPLVPWFPAAANS